MKKKILHITTHLGGGVGKAILGAVSLQQEIFDTKIIVLEEPEKKQIIREAQKEGMQIYLHPSKTIVESCIQEADVVIVSWWNHPLMSEFLWEFPKIPCRLVAWIHVNGCTYPYLPFEFPDRFDYVFFTSRYSYENTLWSGEQLEQLRKKSTVILGNGKFSPKTMKYKERCKEKKEFVLGYVGTLNYSKMNKSFVPYCEEAMRRVQNLKVMLVGDAGQDLVQDINHSENRDKFEICGYMDCVEEAYLSMDALGYLLNDENYGTTENVILEAMAYGVPVIACAGGVEKSILCDKKDGFLVQSKEEFGECVERLAQDSRLRETIRYNARQTVCQKFACEENIKNMVAACLKLCESEKEVHEFESILGATPFAWFLEFTGKDRRRFTVEDANWDSEALKDANPIYFGERKSSLKHFLSYYPQDKNLRMLVHITEKKGGENGKSEI